MQITFTYLSFQESVLDSVNPASQSVSEGSRAQRD